ncbi:MAG: Bro-N domain-containing protein, partial [Macromonas sp.]
MSQMNIIHHDAPAPMGNLQTFRFTDTLILRGFLRDGEPWFVAADVCAALEIGNVSMAANRLDADEKDISTVDTLGGAQELVVINESGLYSLILTSRKPEAKKFKKWVTSEVLPSIRKTGSYTAPAAQPTPKPKQPRIKQPSQVKELLLIGKEMAKITGINPHLVM